MNTISAVLVLLTFLLLGLLWHTMNKKDPPRVRRGAAAAAPPPARPTRRTSVPRQE